MSDEFKIGDRVCFKCKPGDINFKDEGTVIEIDASLIKLDNDFATIFFEFLTKVDEGGSNE